MCKKYTGQGPAIVDSLSLLQQIVQVALGSLSNLTASRDLRCFGLLSEGGTSFENEAESTFSSLLSSLTRLAVSSFGFGFGFSVTRFCLLGGFRFLSVADASEGTAAAGTAPPDFLSFFNTFPAVDGF